MQHMQAKQLGSRPALRAGRYSRPSPFGDGNGGENPPCARVLPSGYIDATVTLSLCHSCHLITPSLRHSVDPATLSVAVSLVSK